MAWTPTCKACGSVAVSRSGPAGARIGTCRRCSHSAPWDHFSAFYPAQTDTLPKTPNQHWRDHSYMLDENY